MTSLYDLADNRAHLDRCTSRIGRAVLAFCRDRAGAGAFRMDELRAHLASLGIVTAPASPDRVLRDLRRRGLVRVECVSRAGSLYRVEA